MSTRVLLSQFEHTAAFQSFHFHAFVHSACVFHEESSMILWRYQAVFQTLCCLQKIYNMAFGFSCKIL